MEPSISIIVPVFNSASYIDSCVDNVLAQDYGNFQLCFVVDGRTADDTVARIEARMGSDDRISYFMQNDDGRMGFARNIGLENTQGDYVWFLDADDVPFPDFIRCMVDTAEDTSSDIVICNFFSSSNRTVPEFQGEFSTVTMDRSEALSARASGKLPVTSWSMIFRRELIIDNGLRFKKGLAEDLDFTYRSLNVAKRVSYCNRPLYLYYQNPNSVCNAESENRRAGEELDVYKGLFELFSNDPDFYPYFSDRAILSTMRCMTHYERKRFVKEYRSNWVRPMLMEMGKGDPFAETFIFKHFPRLYHFIVSTMMKRMYRENLFDNSISSSTAKRWFKKHYQDI